MKDLKIDFTNTKLDEEELLKYSKKYSALFIGRVCAENLSFISRLWPPRGSSRNVFRRWTLPTCPR